MILLDTNIVIDMINNENDANWELLQMESVVICGIVVAELYRGIKNQKELNAVKLFVAGIENLQIENEDWKEIGLFLAKLKKRGLTVPFQDAVIAWICIKNSCALKTNDKHFTLIATLDERLKLFE